MRRRVAGDVCAWPLFGETIRTAQAVRKIVRSFMSVCLDEGLLPGSRMTIDQVRVDNKALTQRSSGPVYESGTGVRGPRRGNPAGVLDPPLNQAQDTRATSKKFALPGDSD